MICESYDARIAARRLCRSREIEAGVTRQQVTTDAASTFSELAHHLQAKDMSQSVLRIPKSNYFLHVCGRRWFTPESHISKLATASVAHPHTFEANAKQLFGGMATGARSPSKSLNGSMAVFRR